MAMTLFTAIRIADRLLPCLPCNAIFCVHGAARGVFIMSDLPDESASVYCKQNAGEGPPPSVLYPLWKMSRQIAYQMILRMYSLGLERFSMP
jgi:hypothetical protein